MQFAIEPWETANKGILTTAKLGPDPLHTNDQRTQSILPNDDFYSGCKSSSSASRRGAKRPHSYSNAGDKRQHLTALGEFERRF